MNSIELLVHLLKDAHECVEATMDGVTDEIAAHMPPGKANPIAGTYAHLIFSEDFFIHGLLQQKAPLFETEWKGKTGISENQPTEWEVAYPKWLKEVKVAIPEAREYAKAVYAATETYIHSLNEADLDREIDMSDFGMGSRTLSAILGGFIIGHARDINGEISVLKGIQGLKGYAW